MSRLEHHIETLLLENDCVTVPGLGGFIAHHIAAQYDAEEGLFLPPYRTLGFNPQLKVNDSLLAQSFVEAYDMAFPEAMRQIEEEVEAMLQTLNNVGVIELNDLGKLRLTAGDKISFEPLDCGILTPRYYGLDSYNFALKVNQDRIVSEVKTGERSDEAGKFVYMDCRNPEDKRISVSLKAIRKVAAVVLFATAMVITLPLNNKSGRGVEQPVKSGVLYNLFDSNKALDTQQNKPVVPSNTITNDKASRSWAIVLASHVTERNAIAFVKDINKAGFNEARVYEGAGSIKVLYGNFFSQEEALKKLNTLRENKFFKEAWVIEINK